MGNSSPEPGGERGNSDGEGNKSFQCLLAMSSPGWFEKGKNSYGWSGIYMARESKILD